MEIIAFTAVLFLGAAGIIWLLHYLGYRFSITAVQITFIHEDDDDDDDDSCDLPTAPRPFVESLN